MFLTLAENKITARRLFIGPFIDASTLSIYSDASIVFGFGVIFGKKWAYAPWGSAFLFERNSKCITALELAPILVALLLWGPELEHSKLMWRSDNMAVCECINKWSAKDVRMFK